MFKKHSFQVKMVKDPEETTDPTILEQLNTMTPEELEELSDRIMKKAAIRIGAIIVTKVAVAIVLSAVTKKLLEDKQ